jgi:ABC-type bacteriocin/lantibiotic exporter with double-glycine peptidase domain
MEQPSEIDAIGMDENQNMQPKNLNLNIKGKIEFKNVWFRYPTRKSDWVLKGLDLTIEA